MFTINTDIDEEHLSVSLTFRNDQVTILTVPESDIGSMDSFPCNGSFGIAWSKPSIIFAIAKHGDGRGGSVVITVENTPEIMNSLRECLTIWKKEYDSLKEAREKEEFTPECQLTVIPFDKTKNQYRCPKTNFIILNDQPATVIGKYFKTESILPLTNDERRQANNMGFLPQLIIRLK